MCAALVQCCRFIVLHYLSVLRYAPPCQVWLFHSLTGSAWDDSQALNRHNFRNGRWYRLRDAPFTPRAYMAHHVTLWPLANESGQPSPPANCTVLVILGGETRYECNNRRLGVCSSEIWHFGICRLGKSMWDEGNYSSPTSSAPLEVVDDLGLTFQWMQPEDMPGPRRCAFIPIFERRQAAGYHYNIITGIGGGQRSYEDSTCQQGIETLSDLWFGFWPYYSNRGWHKSDPLPFAARRSVMLDDALVSTDELVAVVEESPVDKTVSVAGGIRYLSHRFDLVANRSFITAAQMHADAWTCALFLTHLTVAFRAQCDWHYSYPDGRPDSPAPPAPSASLPFPLTSTASVLFPTGRDLLNMRVGGGAPAQALEDIARLRIDNRTVVGSVRLPLPPVSLLRQPNAYRSRVLPGTGTVSFGDVAATRYDLPISYMLDEEELESANSTFVTGSDFLTAHTLLYQQGHAKALFTTWDDGHTGARIAWAHSPLRRVDHTMASTWDTAIISGGESAGVYFNDWYTFEACVCFMPRMLAIWSSWALWSSAVRCSSSQLPIAATGAHHSKWRRATPSCCRLQRLACSEPACKSKWLAHLVGTSILRSRRMRLY